MKDGRESLNGTYRCEVSARVLIVSSRGLSNLQKKCRRDQKLPSFLTKTSTMSRRLATQEARKAFRSREGQARMVRCFATTSAQYMADVAPGQGSKKRVLKEAKKKDDKLRHAINLFQMAEWFFPTTAADDIATSEILSPSSKSKGKSLKTSPAAADTNRKDGLDEMLDDHIRLSIIGSGTSESITNNFNKPVIMQNAYSAELDKAQKDRDQYSSIYNTESPNEEPSKDLLAAIFPPVRPISASKTVSFVMTDSDSKSSMHKLPPVEDREAVEKYLAETVKKANVRASQNRLRASNLDVRGAQVMDALYGTVAGHLPGLEVLKERVKEREHREKVQQEMQNQEDK